MSKTPLHLLATFVALTGACANSESAADVPRSSEAPQNNNSTNSALEVPPEWPEGVSVSIGIEQPTRRNRDTSLFSIGTDLYINVEDGAYLLDPFTATIVATEGLDVILAASAAGIVGESGDQLAAISSIDGQLRLLERPPGRTSDAHQFAIADHRFAMAGDGWLALYDISTGELLWDVDGLDKSPRNIVLNDEALGAIWRTQDQTLITLFDNEDGELIGVDEIPVVENIFYDLLGLLPGRQLLVSKDGDFTKDLVDGQLRLTEAETGTDLWTLDADDNFGHALITNDLIALPNGDGTLVLVDPATGSDVRFPVDASMKRAPLEHVRGVVIVTRDGEVLLVDATSGTQVGESVVLPNVDDILGVTLIGDTYFVMTEESLINNDNDPVTLWGIDVNWF